MDTGAQLKELVRSWNPPAELGFYIPREVKLSGAGKALFVLGVALFLGSLVGGARRYAKAARARAARQGIMTEGTDTAARVVRRWKTGGKEPRYGVDYVFGTYRETYSGRVQVGRRNWDRLDAGSPLQIRYLPENPRRNLVRGFEPDLMPLWVPFALGVSLIAAGFLIAGAIARERSLLSGGRAAPGIVTRHERGHEGKSACFTFSLLSGATAEGKTRPTKKSPPPVGSVLCIIYEQDRPGRNAVYPFSLVKPARAADEAHSRS